MNKKIIAGSVIGAAIVIVAGTGYVSMAHHTKADEPRKSASSSSKSPKIAASLAGTQAGEEKDPESSASGASNNDSANVDTHKATASEYNDAAKVGEYKDARVKKDGDIKLDASTYEYQGTKMKAGNTIIDKSDIDNARAKLEKAGKAAQYMSDADIAKLLDHAGLTMLDVVSQYDVDYASEK